MQTVRIDAVDGGVVLAVRVIPRAGRSRIAGVRGGALLVRLAAAPVEGAANDALIALLADLLHVARSQLALVSGQRSRDKRVRVALDAATVAERLAPHVPRRDARERSGALGSPRASAPGGVQGFPPSKR